MSQKNSRVNYVFVTICVFSALLVLGGGAYIGRMAVPETAPGQDYGSNEPGRKLAEPQTGCHDIWPQMKRDEVLVRFENSESASQSKVALMATGSTSMGTKAVYEFPKTDQNCITPWVILKQPASVVDIEIDRGDKAFRFFEKSLAPGYRSISIRSKADKELFIE